jgi:hypothetical protein
VPVTCFPALSFLTNYVTIIVLNCCLVNVNGVPSTILINASFATFSGAQTF